MVESKFNTVNGLQQILLDNSNDILDIFYTNEAWFLLSEYVQAQNSRIWPDNNTNATNEILVHNQNLEMWIAISRRRVVAPIFFTEIINSDGYCVNTIEQVTSSWKT